MPDVVMRPELLRSFGNTAADTADTLRTTARPVPEPEAHAYGIGFAEAHHLRELALQTAATTQRLLRTLEEQIHAMELTVRMATDATQRTDEENHRALAGLLNTLNAVATPTPDSAATASPREIS